MDILSFTKTAQIYVYVLIKRIDNYIYIYIIYVLEEHKLSSKEIRPVC